MAEVAGIWNCKRSIAKTLLMHYMWDKEKLLSEWSSSAEMTRAWTVSYKPLRPPMHAACCTGLWELGCQHSCHTLHIM